MVDNIKDIKDKFSGFTPYINGYQNMKRASVLIPIIKKDNSYEILFEVRAKTLRSQPNEIAFPGGKIEKGEDPQTACIRETCAIFWKNFRYRVCILKTAPNPTISPM